MKISEETSRQGVFAITGGNLANITDSKKIYGPADISTLFQEKSTEHSDTVLQPGQMT